MAKRPSPVVFDEAWFEADLKRTTAAGMQVAKAARKRFESGGNLLAELRLCEAEGREGAELPRCLKVYLPDASGRFGMVFLLDIIESRGVLRFLAFGVRHHPEGSHAETVYEVAHSRLKTALP